MEKLLEMEQANDGFSTTDVVLVPGANDVVNPAAKTDPSSPIYGMPILDVELSVKRVIVNKRSMKPGYAGIENDLFFQPKTSMLFGDAKNSAAGSDRRDQKSLTYEVIVDIHFGVRRSCIECADTGS